MQKGMKIIVSLDAKPIKLSNEIVLLYLACVWTGHGKEVLVVVILVDDLALEDNSGCVDYVVEQNNGVNNGVLVIDENCGRVDFVDSTSVIQ